MWHTHTHKVKQSQPSPSRLVITTRLKLILLTSCKLLIASRKPLHLLDIYAKLDLLLGLTRGKFIHKTTTCLESRSSLTSQVFFHVLLDVFPPFFKFSHWPFHWDDSCHCLSEEEWMIVSVIFIASSTKAGNTCSSLLPRLSQISSIGPQCVRQLIHTNLWTAVALSRVLGALIVIYDRLFYAWIT